MRYNFTGEFLSDGRAVARALIVLATNNEYNMDTVDAEIALYEYWAIRKQDAVLIDSIAHAAHIYLHTTNNIDFARDCIYKRKTLDDADNRKKYAKICKALYIIFLQTTNAIVQKISVPSHVKPSEILDDDILANIVGRYMLF